MSEWYKADPRKGLEWVREFLVADLRATADGLRREAEFLEGKASLLSDMIDAALHAGFSDEELTGAMRAAIERADHDALVDIIRERNSRAREAAAADRQRDELRVRLAIRHRP